MIKELVEQENHRIMSKTIGIILAATAIVLFAFTIFFLARQEGDVSPKEEKSSPPLEKEGVAPPENNRIPVDGNDADNRIIDGQKDEHGCLTGAGYSWCESKSKCLRIWEEECSELEQGNEN